MQGKSSVEERVAAIHNWVIKNTRYVGLEFGIHGFLPYRVPLIVQRGFGDCKDLSTALITILRELGFEANLALLRVGLDEGRARDRLDDT